MRCSEFRKNSIPQSSCNYLNLVETFQSLLQNFENTQLRSPHAITLIWWKRSKAFFRISKTLNSAVFIQLP